MAATMPKIDVNFRQLAGSLIERSERGVAILIVTDDTESANPFIELKSSADLEEYKNEFTSENYKMIKDATDFAPAKTFVVRRRSLKGEDRGAQEMPSGRSRQKAASATEPLANALKAIESLTKTGWITIVNGVSEDYATLISFVKAQEKLGRTYKAVAYKADAPDSMRVVNFFNDKVVFADERGEQDGYAYLPSLAGILASANVKQGATYYHCSNLKGVKDVDDANTCISKGQFVLFTDEKQVKILLGINSLTTTNGRDLTESMKFIDVVETMDLIKDDISNVFKRDYLGKYSNTYDNQMLLLSSIKAYFKDLENENILDNMYDNYCQIDATAIKNAWLGTGKIEAQDWSDNYAKRQSFKRNVYLLADIKIVEAMENFKFSVELF